VPTLNELAARILADPKSVEALGRAIEQAQHEREARRRREMRAWLDSLHSFPNHPGPCSHCGTPLTMGEGGSLNQPCPRLPAVLKPSHWTK
jgi:hypothetical protein